MIISCTRKKEKRNHTKPGRFESMSSDLGLIEVLKGLLCTLGGKAVGCE